MTKYEYFTIFSVFVGFLRLISGNTEEAFFILGVLVIFELMIIKCCVGYK